MSAVQVFPPFDVFTDTDGQPLENGFIFIGEANLNPEVFPVPIFYDVGLTQPAPQPIRTLGGYPSRNGTPTKIFTAELVYSITVRDKQSELVYSALSSSSSSELEARLSDPTGAANGAALIARGAQVVNSIAELRGLLSTVPSKAAAVLGYYAKGDGGGGVYYLDSLDNVSADNGGTIIVATDGGRWKLQYLESVTVKQFGCKGDNVADDTLRLQAARDWLASTNPLVKLTFPAGIYRYSVSPNWAIGDAQIIAEGEVRLRYFGTGNAVILDAGPDPADVIFNTRMEDFIVDCPSTAQNGVYVRSVHHANLGFKVRGAGTNFAGLQVEFAVCTQFNYTCSVNEENGWYLGSKPKFGWVLTRRTGIESVAFCTFLNCIVEGPEIGMFFDHTLGNIVTGGTSEACTDIGLRLSENALNNRFYGIDFEVNTNIDIYCLGLNNQFYGVESDTDIIIESTARRNSFFGGAFHNITVVAGALANAFYNVQYDRFISGGVFNDLAANTIKRGTINGASVVIDVPAVRTTPVLGVSPATYTNTTGNDQIVIPSGGTVSLLQYVRGGVGDAIAYVDSSPLLLHPGDSLIFTYTVAPTLVVKS